MALRLATNHRKNGSAHNILSGFVSNGSTWSETVVLRDQDGANVTGITGHAFQMQFRCSDDDSAAVLTLTSGDSQLTPSESNGVTSLAISASQSAISSMSGDYVADLVSKTGSTLTHRAHGVVTFNPSPVAF